MIRRPSNRRLRARRRTLQILLWGVALFTGTQLAAGLAFDHYWPQIRFPQAGDVFRRLDAVPSTPEIVCLGSSRAQCDLPEPVLNPVLRQYLRPAPRFLNGSVGAGDAMVAEWMLRRMLDAGHRPKLVIVEVLPENLAARCLWIEQQVFRHVTWAELPGCAFPACRHGHPMRVLRSRAVPLFFHRYHVRKQLGGLIGSVMVRQGEPAPPPLGCDVELVTVNETGLPPEPSAIPPSPTASPAAAPHAIDGVRDWLRDYELDGVMPKALERLLKRCRAEGIDVLLLAPPVSRAHAELYTAGIESAFVSYLHELAARYGCHVADYRRRIPEEGFMDTHHLNAAGANYLCKLLAREVLIPEWRARD